MEEGTPVSSETYNVELVIKNLLAQIKQLSIDNPIDENEKIAEGGGRLISYYLDQKQWWRLYILPADQQKAMKDHKDAPGTSYVSDFGKLMEEEYGEVLNKNNMTVEDLNWTKYTEIWAKVVPEKTRRKVPNASTPSVSFPSCMVLAEDSKSEVLCGRRLVASNPGSDQMWLDREHCPLTRHFELGKRGFMIATKYVGDQAANLVDTAFNTFRAKIDVATTRWDQLRAIARLIRLLHVVHVFPDGNGRLNVYIILPFLLLKYGFGLPLGGANYSKLDPHALNEMFSGGFSINQMAAFLWYAQDFGKEAEKYGAKDSILNH